jgi:hypothetical protein
VFICSPSRRVFFGWQGNNDPSNSYGVISIRGRVVWWAGGVWRSSVRSFRTYSFHLLFVGISRKERRGVDVGRGPPHLITKPSPDVPHNTFPSIVARSRDRTNPTTFTEGEDEYTECNGERFFQNRKSTRTEQFKVWNRFVPHDSRDAL